MNTRASMTNTTLGLALSAVLASTACNAIFSIDEGHLAASAGGKSGGTGGNSESGGATASTDAGKDAATVDSGSGGRTSTGGTTGTGGETGTGGRTSTGGSENDAGPGSKPGEIRCEGTPGCTTKEECCVDTKTFEGHCSPQCDPSLQVAFKCDGPEDCTNGAAPTCCVGFGQTTATCSATCTGGRVICGKDADCDPGQYCERGVGVYGAVAVCADVPIKNDVWCGKAPCDVAGGKVCCYNKVLKGELCAATCTGANEIPLACDGPEDCPVAAAVCCASHTGVGLFTGTHCAAVCDGADTVTCGGARGCLSGSVCCHTGDGASCQATCRGDTVCSTSADCSGKSCEIVTDVTLGKPTGILTCQ